MKKYFFFLSLSAMVAVTSCKQNAENNPNGNNVSAETIQTDGTSEILEMPAPPNAQAPVGNRDPKQYLVKLETIEKTGQLANGSEYHFWTFNGTVPGSFIRARIGDEIELHLKNNENNSLPHNIDLHAVNGPGGGAEATFVAPGK